MYQLSFRIRPLLVLCASVLLSGCLSVQPQATLPQAPVEEVADLTPVPMLQPYRLQVGDVLDIKMLMNPELNEQVTIPPDGLISTTVSQNVLAYGLTASELEKQLESEYSRYLQNPNVAVIVRSFAPSRVYVLGEVNTPGEFITVGPNLTVLQAVARAGGLKHSADVDNMIIVRRGSSTKAKAYTANFRAAATGNTPEADVRLAPYDVVYVPRTGIGEVYLHYNQYLQQFMPASFGLSYQLNPADVD